MASRFWRSAAQYFAGGVGLVLVTFVCVRFGQDIHVAAFGYLILIVLLALTSEFIGSVVLSVAAAGCLTYLRSVPAQFPAGLSGGCHNDSPFLDDFILCQRSHYPAQLDRREIAQSAGRPRECRAPGNRWSTDRLDWP